MSYLLSNASGGIEAMPTISSWHGISCTLSDDQASVKINLMNSIVLLNIQAFVW